MSIVKGLKIKTNFNSPPTQNAITLISVLHNEEDNIDFFINHYLSLGVTHFIFIDNGSTDQSYSKISKYTKKHNILVYYTEDSYKENNFGLLWVNRVLRNYKNNWFLVVDMDEIIVLKNNQTLSEVREKMSTNKKNIANFMLIDFYPIEVMSDHNDLSNLDPFKITSYYDKFIKLRKSSCFKYLKIDTKRGHPLCAWGGFRERVYNKDKKLKKTYMLSKKSFFKYDFGKYYEISVGYHWILKRTIFKLFSEKIFNKLFRRKLKFTNEMYVICHFKYFKKNYENFLTYKIDRNQDWDNSAEYKTYKSFSRDFSVFFNSQISKKFSSVNELYADTVDLIN